VVGDLSSILIPIVWVPVTRVHELLFGERSQVIIILSENLVLTLQAPKTCPITGQEQLTFYNVRHTALAKGPRLHTDSASNFVTSFAHT